MIFLLIKNEMRVGVIVLDIFNNLYLEFFRDILLPQIKLMNSFQKKETCRQQRSDTKYGEEP